ncbi:MAG TPA: alpha-amlyase [Bacteroidales bacterium]|nr:alpha-amlyase [Bacteroidales bacterium]
MKKGIFIFGIVLSLCFTIVINSFASDSLKVEPPFWWEKMEYHNIEILVYAEDIQDFNATILSPTVQLNNTIKPANKNYVFLDVTIGEAAQVGFEISFRNDAGKTITYWYELKTRKEGAREVEGFNSSDVMYLLMPDRFANSIPENDNIEGMLEKANREKSQGRHGGDIQGIIDHLDYIQDLGYTAIWINPVLENNMPRASYHGYAITDFYHVDARYGGNEAYLKLSEEMQNRGMKLIQDMVFNHAGTETYWVKDMPMDDWINIWPEFTRSNYHGEVNNDGYASDFDKNKMERGWFDRTMADLNQRNPHMLKYLTQNSIWWIEYAGLQGIRMDTYPYPEKNAMAEWAKTIKEIYPNFSVVAESWLNFPVHTAYWQANANTPDGYNSHIKSVTDFPVYEAIRQAFNEPDGWQEGVSRIYFTLTQDYLYPNPQNLLIFPDNHDLQRLATTIDGDMDKFKQIMTFIATTRGIPQIYYGTEIMMDARPYKDHGSWRRDYPGGWNGDKKNAFTGQGLSKQELEAQAFTKKLLNWRKEKSVIHSGKYKHFIPQDHTYVYARFNDDETVVVILNRNNKSYNLELERYNELFSGHTKAYEVLSGKEIELGKALKLHAHTPMILELKK